MTFNPNTMTDGGKPVEAKLASPGIPGDDIPLTDEESEEFDALAKKLTGAPNAPKFTPPPVKGYRALTQVEVDMMNMIKAKGEELEDLILSVGGHLLMQRKEATHITPVQYSEIELKRIDRAEPNRWTAIARTHFQEGLMALVRAVSQPSNF